MGLHKITTLEEPCLKICRLRFETRTLNIKNLHINKTLYRAYSSQIMITCKYYTTVTQKLKLKLFFFV